MPAKSERPTYVSSVPFDAKAAQKELIAWLTQGSHRCGLASTLGAQLQAVKLGLDCVPVSPVNDMDNRVGALTDDRKPRMTDLRRAAKAYFSLPTEQQNVLFMAWNDGYGGLDPLLLEDSYKDPRSRPRHSLWFGTGAVLGTYTYIVAMAKRASMQEFATMWKTSDRQAKEAAVASARQLLESALASFVGAYGALQW